MPAQTEDRRNARGSGRALLLTLAVLVVLGGVIALVDRLSADPQDTPEDSVALTTLTDEQLASVQVAAWETWAWGPVTHYLAWVEAPGLDHERVRLSVTVQGTDTAGATHETSTYVELRAGERALLTGAFDGPVDAPVADLTLTPESGSTRPVLDGELTVQGHSIEPDGVQVRLLASGQDAIRVAWVTVVVRSATGEITHLGRQSVNPAPRPGSGSTVDVSLWGPETVSSTDDVEVLISY
ncbi:MAG: hypothetical protein GX593_05610 [Actinomycetales bacterium]|nr:hypothetical protein [Actinomycetales bacterium]